MKRGELAAYTFAIVVAAVAILLLYDYLTGG